jgi:hypothetical protein
MDSEEGMIVSDDGMRVILRELAERLRVLQTMRDTGASDTEIVTAIEKWALELLEHDALHEGPLKLGETWDARLREGWGHGR